MVANIKRNDFVFFIAAFLFQRKSDDANYSTLIWLLPYLLLLTNIVKQELFYICPLWIRCYLLQTVCIRSAVCVNHSSFSSCSMGSFSTFMFFRVVKSHCMFGPQEIHLRVVVDLQQLICVHRIHVVQTLSVNQGIHISTSWHSFYSVHT